MVDFSNRLLIAVLIGWILTVVLHEFAHGLVAHWGGDYTVRERGGMSLNPLQYIHPVNSLLLPAIFLLMGGVPLPGGVNYIRMDLIRSKAWQSAVSAAGPAMNLILFGIGLIALHPKVGWIPEGADVSTWSAGQIVAAALTMLQVYAVFLNLLPIPPLDGFGVIAPFLKPQVRIKLMTPPTNIVLLIITFVVVTSGTLDRHILDLMSKLFLLVGYDADRVSDIRLAFLISLFGER